MLLAEIDLHDRHTIGGQRSRLVRTDGRGIAHGFAGVQVANQIVIDHHFLQRTRDKHFRRRERTMAHVQGY